MGRFDSHDGGNEHINKDQSTKLVNYQFIHFRFKDFLVAHALKTGDFARQSFL